MPALNSASTTPHHAPRLRDLFSNFDALLLDGFGVLNVGADLVLEADQMVTTAQDQGLTVMVLTNGASKDKSTAALKYRALGLPIDPSHVISSRDALFHQLDQSGHNITRLGVVDSYTDIPTGYPFDCLALSPESPQDWLTCDAIGFFGAVHWHEGWQDALKAAIKAGVQIMVANPDVTAPFKAALVVNLGSGSPKLSMTLALPLKMRLSRGSANLILLSTTSPLPDLKTSWDTPS